MALSGFELQFTASPWRLKFCSREEPTGAIKGRKCFCLKEANMFLLGSSLVEVPITFCEETFVSHRSATMRQFLQNAIQLQLFKQFIDGRLDLLNSGEGFSDVFEEEINMSEYAGSDNLYHQWLSTVRKGSGAILNTVKTKANPAMKTVYKFAKDHAKMGIKEVKNRLKQKLNMLEAAVGCFFHSSLILVV
uniref:DENN domain-containing protein 1A n=1 Tax=Sphaerodactylus townsendi TaxID=933632 RepID=A0ACB8EZW1_9SAUR